jgi:Zn-dependent protease with chaperone function
MLNAYILFAILSFINSFILNQPFLALLVLFLIEAFTALMYFLAFSRWREAKADEYAKKSLGDGKPLASFLERCIEEYENLKGIKLKENSKNGEQYFYMHPMIFDRIRKLKE